MVLTVARENDCNMYELASRKQRIADLMSFDSSKSGAEYDFFRCILTRSARPSMPTFIRFHVARSKRRAFGPRSLSDWSDAVTAVQRHQPAERNVTIVVNETAA